MTLRTIDQITDFGPRPDLVPTFTGMPPGPVTLSSDEWAVIWLIDGQSTVQELAWSAGLGVTEALLAFARLAQAGLCSLPATSAPDGQAQWPAPTLREAQEQPEFPGPPLPVVSDSPAGPEPAVAVDPVDLPRRDTRPTAWDMATTRPGDRIANPSAEPLVAPDPELLLRVLRRLKNLD